VTAARGSGYDLFGNRLFRNLWGANLIHALGLVMLLLGASWVLTSLTDNPLLVSMVQTMMSLPFLFFSIPAGVLGGYLMGLAGIAVLLFTRAVSHLVMIAALLRIPKSRSATPGGSPNGAASPRSLRAQVGSSVRDGWRAVTGSPQLYGPLLRCVTLMVPVGAVLALLPLEAKENI
jgi:hypothetical protein